MIVKVGKNLQRIFAMGMVMVFVIVCSNMQVQAIDTRYYTYTESPYEAMLYTTTKVWACPEADFWFIGNNKSIALEPNTLVHVTAITDNGWYRIEINGSHYYVRQTQVSEVMNPKGAPTLIDPNSIYEPLQYQEVVVCDGSNSEAVMNGYLEAIEHHAPVIVFLNEDNKERNIGQAEIMKGMQYCDSTYMNYAQATYTGINREQMITYVSTVEEELAIEAIVGQLLPTYNVGTDYDKINAVYNLVRNTATYCTDTQRGKADNRSAYDIFANNKSFGPADALLFQKFMDMMRITSYIGHSMCSYNYFNIVYLDGQWYYIDCIDSQNKGLFLKGATCNYGSNWDGIPISSTDYGK